MQYFVGLDWAAREHAVCVIDGRGAVVAQSIAIQRARPVKRLWKTRESRRHT